MTTRRLATDIGLVVAGASLAILGASLLQAPAQAKSLHERLVEACRGDELVNWAANDPLGYIPQGVVVATCEGEDGPYQVGVVR